MSLIGAYSTWAAGLTGDEPPKLSFRRTEFTDLDAWRAAARQKTLECLAMPDLGPAPGATVDAEYTYDGLHVEELSWQLPYGPRTQAILLKPQDATDRLPGILALHDHAGNKYFGKRKIARITDTWHPALFETHDPYYASVNWANEVARRGYVVLVPDAFTFGSRRVRLQDVPPHLRGNLADTSLVDEPKNSDQIAAYNEWASAHESIMAKALFAAGTSWPGVFLAEDRIALDVLCGREDVDAARVGCGGLSGGGLRTVFLAGLDSRIRCAVCVGMMTTWRDFSIHVADKHTWMAYVPLLPQYLDYSEVFGLRVPMPALIQSNREDHLFTLAEMERANEILRQVYSKAGAVDRYRATFYSGDHKFDRQMQAEAFDWFDRWLTV